MAGSDEFHSVVSHADTARGDVRIGQTDRQIRPFVASSGALIGSIQSHRPATRPGVDAVPERMGSVHPDPETSADEGEMQIVYVMEVIDPVERHGGARCVRRFTYETREEAWAKYCEALRFGFEAYVEKVGRLRGVPTLPHGHVARSSSAPTSRVPPDGVFRERQRSGQGGASALPSASRDR